MLDPNKAMLTTIKKSVKSKKVRELAVLAVKSGVRFRATTSGFMFYGQNGYSFTIHTTESDHRAQLNAEARFRKIGIERKGRKK